MWPGFATEKSLLYIKVIYITSTLLHKLGYFKQKAKKKRGLNITKDSLRSNTAKQRGSVAESGLFVKEIDFESMLANEMELTATVTGKLPKKIEKFRDAMIEEV